MSDERSSSEAPPIGIDLGTTYSVVAVYRKGRADALHNDSGSRTTPSAVGFYEDGQQFVGEAAKDLPPGQVIFDAKRMIGRKFCDKDIQNDMKRWPFTVIEEGGAPRVRVTVNGTKRDFSPEEISKMVLSELKQTAEDFLEVPVKKAVITVPAYFNEKQRHATITAGKLAGLEVIAIINEPTAAAIAYGFDRIASKKTVFVYDLGGGTFDASVLVMDGKRFRVLSSGGDTHLGGQDFDVRIMNHFMKDIYHRFGVRVEDDPQTLQHLRTQCETAKKSLSKIAEVPLAALLHKVDKKYNSSLSRTTFEGLCEDLFNRTIELSRDVIRDAKVDIEDIDEVLLVGGSTRIPKIRGLVQELFNGRELSKTFNPDEVVAVGAALHAASLCGSRGACDIKLKEVTTLSLGVATYDGLMVKLIPRNSPLPAVATRSFTTAHDEQDEAEFKICRGERARWEDNDMLSSFVLRIPPCSKGKVCIKTTFKLDENCLLSVTATEESTGEEVEVQLESLELTEEELAERIQQALRFQEEDEEERKRAKKH